MAAAICRISEIKYRKEEKSRMKARIFGFTMILLAISTSVVGDFVKTPCENRKNEADGNGPLPVYSCGSDVCPPGVKTEGTIVHRAELPLEGYLVYIANGRMYRSDLKDFNPEEIAGAGTGLNHVPLQISDDGNWILYHNNNIVSIEGKGRQSLSPVGPVAWLRNSFRGTTDIVWCNKNSKSVSVKELTLGDENVTTGDWTEVADGIDLRKDFFAAGYKYFTSQNAKSEITHPWGFSEETYNGGFWEIPSTGKASSGDMFRACPIATFVCAQTFSPDGKLVAANFEHGYQDCMPEQHKGFCVTPVRKFDGAPEDWILQDDISVNFVPAEYELESGETTNLRNGNVPSNDFSFYEWTNKEDWIAGVHYGNNTQVFGAWLINWKTNQWTLLTDEDTQVSKAAVYITEETTSVKQPQNRTVQRSRHHKGRMLHQWHNVLGREVSAGAIRRNGTPVGASGIYIDVHGKTKIVR